MKSFFVGLVGSICFLPLLGSMATAQDLNFQDYRRFLMQGNSAGKKMAIQTSCTAPDGQVYRIGEKGYDACFSGLKNRQKQNTEKTETNESSAGAGTTIHFGN